MKTVQSFQYAAITQAAKMTIPTMLAMQPTTASVGIDQN
jgi:hypothetical protein